MSRYPTGTELLESLGAAIAQRRRELHLSQEELGDLSGVHRTYISDLERGLRNVSILTLERVASALQLPLVVLMMLDVEPPKPVKKRGKS